ncbi:MATE family efflux transporter [Enterovibrio paralichthyis]|uniref:MATE family efflux transporter n=1 Tax=Enterovibrio paralichthyis TaxID=2853805 RepID=UPI001C467ED6|nr:MATE family efflux transporter [Enterovibrio paralichthyis]MBV7300723.1 MATE family efflux transporter [Enterovibrio paralichthyis]
MHLESLKPGESLTKTFWRYTIPAIAAMVVNGLYQMVDGIFVGHYIGAEGLEAINIGWPVIAVVGGTGLMIGMGSGSLISIYRGEGNLTGARTAMATGLVLTILLGLVASAYLLVGAEKLVDLQGVTGVARDYAINYLMVYALCAAVTVASSALPFLIRNDDSPVVATAMMVVGALANIVLDYLFIGVLDFKLAGAAWATVLAQGITVVIAMAYLLSKRSYLAIFRHKLNLSLSDAKQSMAMGVSSLVMFLYYGVLVAIHNRLFAEYGSPLSIASFAIVGYLMTLYYVVAEGIAEGMQPQVSYYHGAKQYQNIVKVAKLATVVSLGAGILWLAVLNLFPDTMIGLFNNANETLMKEATYGMRIHLSAMYLDGLIVLASMYFLSVGKGGTSLAISVGNMLVQFPFLAILPRIYGVDGVWMSMPISNVVLASIVIPVMWRHIYRQKRTMPIETAAAV